MARLTKPEPAHPGWVDVGVGLAAGLVATLVTDLAQGPLRRMTPERIHRHEKRVRPGASSSLVAARKVCETMNVAPSPRRHARAGKAIHLATGMGWGPVYGLLRRYAGLAPLPAALACGTAMSLILDECLVPTLGLSAPNRRYPAFTHVRGLVAHLVYGAAVAAVAEGFGRAVGRPPEEGGGSRGTRTGRLAPDPSLDDRRECRGRAGKPVRAVRPVPRTDARPPRATTA